MRRISIKSQRHAAFLIALGAQTDPRDSWLLAQHGLKLLAAIEKHYARTKRGWVANAQIVRSMKDVTTLAAVLNLNVTMEAMDDGSERFVVEFPDGGKQAL